MKLDIKAMARESKMGRAAKQNQEDYWLAYREDLEAFARLIVERCAEECEAISVDKWALYKGRKPYSGREPGRADPDTQGQSDGADSCAAAIRSLMEDDK